MGELSGDRNRVTTECGHQFHTKCLLSNVAYNGFGCPYCRSEMVEESVANQQHEDDDEEDDEDDDDEDDDEDSEDDKPVKASKKHRKSSDKKGTLSYPRLLSSDCCY
jgi:hypothetical protein